jgi:hypothetical protein
VADIEWDDAELAKMFHDPDGPLHDVMERCGGIVETGAKRRAEKRSGRMRAAIEASPVAADDQGIYVDVHSPVLSKTGFPYATVHEGRNVRDRRAHRSLKPALNDLKKLGFTGQG